jgi:hypothetical protein
MKKLALLAIAFGMAVSAYAQAPAGLPISALGYDGSIGHITGRMGLSENTALDLGIGFGFDATDDGDDDDNLQFGVSGFFLTKLHDWGPVDNYIALGGVISKLPQADDNISVNLFAGFQPEITLLDRLIVSTRFGVSLDVMPAFILATAGQGISIVEGLNFKILF